MKIIDYIKGDKRGRDANELERRALRDPFLADAMEGYESVRHENHFDKLIELNRNILLRSGRNRHRTLYRTIGYTTGIAALIAIGFGVWTIMPISKTDQATMQDAMLAQLEGSTTIVGTIEELLAQAQESVAYRDVYSYDSIEMFIAAQPKSKLATISENIEQAAAIRSNIQANTINHLDTITNSAFVNYFEANRKVRGVTGAIVIEFGVGDSGRPSKINVLSAPTQTAGREAINLLISGPAWQPTKGNRVRTILAVND